MNPNLLLSPALRAKVETKVKECLEIAKKEYKREFKMPEIRYDVKNTHGGIAMWPSNIIRLNLILMVENEEKFLATTVPHEVAHLIVHAHFPIPEGKKKLMPHGKEWKQVMALFKVPAKVTHTYDCSSIARRPKKSKGTGGRRVDPIKVLAKNINRLGVGEIARLRSLLNDDLFVA